MFLRPNVVTGVVRLVDVEKLENLTAQELRKYISVVGDSVLLNAPLYALPSGVRAVETMTASRMA